MKIFLLYGPPGSGKGTQRKYIESNWSEKGYNFMSTDMGSMLRDYTKEIDTVGKRYLKEYIDSGALVPSSFPITFIAREFASKKVLPEYVLLDGGARKPVEVDILFGIFSLFSDVEVKCIVLELSYEQILERVADRGRIDDTESVLVKRIEEWQNDVDGTYAALNRIKGKENTTMYSIDGDGTVEEVNERINKILI